ncbi:hypothetical protein NQ318_017203 [Aromia moschata]|uniref:Uncharacterized protein n=1 Tax=Aromia moschata TaxID=1265417 RepID=A0AAV8YP71_9CUCU|nr:hypothetical protein NQ318_017203 [Aromia moschata]
MVLKTLFCVIFLIQICYGANILAIVPTPSYSHQVAFAELWKELSLRGHHVTLVTTDPRNDPNLPNLREINMRRSYRIWSETDITEDQLRQPELQELIHESNKFKFDLVMVEVFYPELIAFAKIYKCPTILVATIGSTVPMYQDLGNPAHPVLNSDINVPYDGTLNFKERLISTLFYWRFMYFEYFISRPKRQETIDRFFSNVTSIKFDELISDIDVVLVNESPLLKGVRALGPTTVPVGGGIHLKPLKPLPHLHIRKSRKRVVARANNLTPSSSPTSP